MGRRMILATVGLAILTGCSAKPTATAHSTSFDDLNKVFKTADAITETGYDQKVKASEELWAKYPTRRIELIKQSIEDMDADIHRRGIIYSKLQVCNWNLDFSASERIELPKVIGKAISAERTNLIQDLCILAQKKKLKVVLPELKAAAGSRKDGTNKKILMETIKKLT